MGLFDKLRGGSKESTTVVDAPACLHVALLPRWDSVADIGKEDRATSFVCESCQESFSPDAARELRRTQSERLANVGA